MAPWRNTGGFEALFSEAKKPRFASGKSYGQSKAGITAMFMFKYGGISVESNKDHSEVV